MFQVLCLVVVVFIPLVLGQVNFSIDQDEDLLALDSLHDEVWITIHS